jgi:hypothetical protein
MVIEDSKWSVVSQESTANENALHTIKFANGSKFVTNTPRFKFFDIVPFDKNTA